MSVADLSFGQRQVLRKALHFRRRKCQSKENIGQYYASVFGRSLGIIFATVWSRKFRNADRQAHTKVVDLYRSGLSLQAVAWQVHRSKTFVRKTLLKHGLDLRADSHNQVAGGVKTKAMAIKNAPYGFCLVNGGLLEDPKEIAVVLLIIKWWQRSYYQPSSNMRISI